MATFRAAISIFMMIILGNTKLSFKISIAVKTGAIVG